MTRRVDQIQVVDLTIFRFVLQRSGLCFDSYPTFFFDVHRVENLRFHVALFKSSTTLNQTICERRFAVIDVGND